MFVPGRSTLLRLKHLYNRMSLKYISQQVPRRRPLSNSDDISKMAYVYLIFPATTFCLGTWQIRRYKWKKELIAKLEERLELPPIDLPEETSELDDLEYFRVQLRGKFDYSKEMLIAPRQDYSLTRRLATPVQGAHVVVPFQLSDSGRRILVNRGFVTSEKISPDRREEGQVTDEVEITGIIRKGEVMNIILNRMNKPKKYGYFMGRDVKVMSEMAQTEPIFVDADLNSSVEGGPRGGQTILKLRDEHMNYIIVWYTLTIYMLYRWVKHVKLPKSNMIKAIQAKF